MMSLIRFIVSIAGTIILGYSLLPVFDTAVILIGVVIAFLWEIAARLAELNKNLATITTSTNPVAKKGIKSI